MICDGISYDKYIKKGINIFLIFGSEIALKNNAKDDIRKHLSLGGFSEKRIVSDDEFDKLDQIISENAGGSLFASKILIEISHTRGKISDAIQTIPYIDGIESMDNIAIIIDTHTEKINNRLKWFKAMDEISLIVECKKLKSFEEKIWLKKQLEFIDAADRSKAATKISTLGSGNLVAQQNEVRLLRLLNNGPNLSDALHVKDRAEFVPFELEDMIVKKNVQGALRIIESIKELDSHYAALLVWVVGKIINNSAAAMQSNKPDATLIKMGVWNNKISDYKIFMRSFSIKRMVGFQKAIFELDLSNKGINKANFWERLSDLVLELATN